jgi:amino acid adenylation domain-containing protein
VLFEAQAAKTPSAVAVVAGEKTLTYGELNARANQLAQFLIAQGVRSGQRVATLLERSLELVIAEIAILKCGAAYVPLDWNAPAERHAFMIDDCQVGAIVTVAGSATPDNITRVHVDEDPWREFTTTAPPAVAALTSDAVAYVMYTSGSTGKPKGVVIPHRGIARLLLNNGCTQFTADDRIAFTASPAFDASTFEMWAPLLHGACLVIVPQAVLLDADALALLLRAEKVTVLQLVAGLLSAYAEPLADLFPQLRYLMTGGDVADPRALARILRNPPQHLIQTYGPTEATTFVTAWDVTSLDEHVKRVPIGSALSNTRIYILDRARQPVPIGVVGELYIGGDGIAHGYWNRPDLTAQKFVDDPFSDEPRARMYKTGDLARRLPDGKIDFIGRNDTQVKLRGIRIELGEIEMRLAEYPGIREAIVLAREDATGEKRLVAYVVGNADTEALRQHSRARLPEVMVPASYVFLDALPLTANGKVDRKALPAPADTAPAKIYEPPQGEVEAVIASIWAELLGIGRVGRQDNFFELGGHSLLAVTLMDRMRRRGVPADVRTVFTSPTLAGLAANIGPATPTVEIPPNLIPELPKFDPSARAVVLTI